MNFKYILEKSKQFIGVIIMNTQPSPSPQPSSSLRGEQIHMSNLYASHRKSSITPKYKFQDE